LKTMLGPTFRFLTTAPDGTPVFVLSSFTNLGDVETQGADLSFRWSASPRWSWSLSYSWLDFDPGTATAGAPDALLANAPEHRAAGEVGYTGNRWDAALVYRWMDDFRWSSDSFRGPVDSYGTVNLFANVALGSHWSLGLAVTNLTDEEHWETFGGDLLARRALGSVTLRW
ncbi:MAG: TonB-dependent receptor, partial [Thermoanaerobaculia bacterium]|nr:TonB-dependent receptor [Thermoanaerobaculia bacterium]